MRIIRAEHLGMCFGVREAITLALRQAESEPLTVLGDLVHNETVLAELRAQSIRVAQQPADVGTRTVMVTAHGASERALSETRGRSLNVIEATCPACACGTSRGDAAGARRFSSSHHRQARPRRGARHDRGP